MGAKAGALQSAELGNFGAQLVHNNLQMRSMGATESALNHSKQKKRGEYEQGRKISKPPRPDVGDRPRTAPQLVASMLQEAIVSGSAASERPGQWPTRSKRDLANFVAKWIFMTIPQTGRKCRLPRIYWLKLAGATGLEPATSCVTGRRSNQLNYAPAN